jgi:hypothetical protein
VHIVQDMPTIVFTGGIGLPFADIDIGMVMADELPLISGLLDMDGAADAEALLLHSSESVCSAQ